MLFNWQVQDVCVVFEWWHIHTGIGLFLSCVAVFAIAACYELLRAKANDMDQTWITKNQGVLRSSVYAILVAISFWLMLVFMTYNGYLMIAVVLGAGVGHYYTHGRLAASRSIQCH
ncbi:hypothetical protein BDA99DRAFT_521294 [Phascolomyces articulosus]|uniref:Copper transport protein n=1 Tax=Phascolomyces articulosus TaxID=60185 RepID=A0AAD5JS47_9FUNG|nr:hypothetical protein BDA99DRAFT_521294 [Phascolomyces articulosus]